MPVAKLVATNEFRIEKGVPFPAAYNKYPFRSMEVGDSFAVSTAMLAAVRNASAQCGRRYDWKFSVRKDGSGYRCWRVA